jgi:hypothetical protein
MTLKKDSLKGDSDEKLEARADVDSDREKEAPKPKAKVKKEGDNLWKLDPESEVESPLVLSVGGTNYEFRKNEPVNLPLGQAVDHPDIHEVK